MIWFLVFLIDAGEPLDETFTCLFVQAFRVSLLADVQWCVDENFEKGEIGFFVNLPSHLSVSSEGRHETAEAYVASVSEKFCHLKQSKNN